MGDIGVPELLIILAIAIILFGPARIGGIGKSLGEAIRSFRQEVRDESERATTGAQEALVAESAERHEVNASVVEATNPRE
jgi:sec-independent protein translocase protein TatA